MKKKIFLLLIFTLFLTGCQFNRFNSKTMDDYLEEYNISNVHFSERQLMSIYGWEVYVETGNINNEYNQETESMCWALGEDSNGELVILIVPSNTKYDIVQVDSPFPKPNDLLAEIEDFSKSNTDISALQFNLENNKYGEFISIYDIQLNANDFFNNKSLTSSFLVELGTYSYNDETFALGLISLNEQIVVIAFENLNDNDPIDLEIFELFVLK